MSKKFIAFICLLLLLTGCKEKEEVVIEPVVEEIEETEQIYTLIMGGDALTHESVYLDNKTDMGYDFTYVFRNIKDIVKECDLAYYNQETVLGGSDYLISGYPVFNTPQEVGDALIGAGFNMASLASNHLLDNYATYGNKLIISQLNYFKNKDIVTAGSYLSQEERDNPKTYEIDGLTYGFLSYTEFSNCAGPKADEKYLINFIDKDLIKQDVEKIRDKVDLLIVAMHWGDENTNEVNAYQKEYAQFLADLDVDIVIGCHSHILEPIEWIDDTLVIYSLGNLYSNQYFNIDNLSSALVSIDIVKNIKDDEVTITLENLRADLIFTVLKDKHSIYLYRDLTDNELINHEEYFNKYKDVLNRYTSVEVK